MPSIHRLSLNKHRLAQDWVEGINSAAPLILPSPAKGDTLELAIRNFEVNPAIPALTVFVEEPWSFSQIRASIGFIDAAPERGTFQLKVGANTTAALTWCADASTPALISAWKATILAAIIALPSVGVGAIRSDDPTGAPVNFLYFTWTNSADTRVIEVVVSALQLTPAVEAIVQPTQSAPAFSQLIKFVQLPFAITTGFSFVAAPIPVISPDTTGAPGTNAVQILTIATASSGAFALTWGSNTRPINVANLTAATIDAALNEIVSGGFRVTLRSRNRFGIEFIGSLAGAPQIAIAVVPKSEPNYTATALLPLTSARFDRALNGAASVPLRFAVTIVDGDGPITILRDIILQAPMTRDATIVAVEAAGAVLVVTKTIYIDAGMGTAFASLAPGASFVPPTTGNTLVITHGLNTMRPGLRVTLHEVNHTTFASDPSNLAAALTGSRCLDDVEFTNHTTAPGNVTTITLPWTLVNDPTSDLDYRLLRVDISSPDTQLLAFPHKHLWTDVLESIPGGQSAATKFAALDAALGIFGGTLSVDASRITGLIKGAQIDAASLSTILRTSVDFLKALRELVKDSTLIDTVGELLAASEKFLATLITLCTGEVFLTAFVPKLLDDPAFATALTARVLSALTAGGSLPDGTIALVIPDFSIALPPSCLIGLVANSALASYGELTFARTGLTAGAALSGELSSVPVATVHQVAAPGAFSQDFRSRRGVDFKVGAYIVNPNGFWYEVTNFGSGTDWWPVEGEQTIFDLPVSANDFYPGSQFLLACPYQLALLGAYEGRILLVLETGVDTIEATTQLASVAWTALQTTVLNLNSARAFRKISYRATRAANGTTFAAFINNAAVEAATTAPATANFRLRLRTTKLDLANPATGAVPTGSFVITAANIRAAFTPL